MASIINATTTNGVAVQGDNSGSLQLQTNSGTTAVTIDTSQNVGIGTSSPSYKLDVQSGTARIYNSTFPSLRIQNSATGTNSNDGLLVEMSGSDALFVNYESANMIFKTADTERMRIDSSGNLLVGTTNNSIGNNFTTVGTGNSALNLNSSGTSNTYTTLGFFNQNNYHAQIFWQQSNDNFYVQNNNNGVYLSANATSWTANSDERLKENLVPIENGLEKVCSLRSVIGNFKSDETKKPRPFLIAQDVQAVLPEAVSSSRIKGDETQIEYLGVAYTEIIPLLVASIKELNAKVDAQAAEIQALKGVA